MMRDKEFPVYGIDGFRATLLAPARFLDNSTQKRLRLEDGREIFVPATDLELKQDGSFYLRNPLGIGDSAPSATEPVPDMPPEPQREQAAPVAEAAPVARSASPVMPVQAPVIPAQHQVVAGASFTGEPLFRENCDIKRVPMKRLLDKPAEPRQEGDTYIVPLMEEVLVLEKRLLLREELHITRRREQNPHVLPVRKEELDEPPAPSDPDV